MSGTGQMQYWSPSNVDLPHQAINHCDVLVRSSILPVIVSNLYQEPCARCARRELNATIPCPLVRCSPSTLLDRAATSQIVHCIYIGHSWRGTIKGSPLLCRRPDSWKPVIVHMASVATNLALNAVPQCSLSTYHGNRLSVFGWHQSQTGDYGTACPRDLHAMSIVLTKRPRLTDLGS